MRYPPKSNSISELRKLNKNQADQPMRGIDDDIIMEGQESLQIIKHDLINSQPHPVSSVSYKYHTFIVLRSKRY